MFTEGARHVQRGRKKAALSLGLLGSALGIAIGQVRSLHYVFQFGDSEAYFLGVVRVEAVCPW